MFKRLFSVVSVAGALLLPAAAAQASQAMVTSNVNLRAGPGTNYQRVLTLPQGAGVEVYGCLNGYSWCDVSYGPDRGWVSSRYLSIFYANRVYAPMRPTVVVPFLTFDFGYWDRHYTGRPWYAHRPRPQPGNAPWYQPNGPRPQPGNAPWYRPNGPRPQGGDAPWYQPNGHRPQPGNMPSMRPDRPQGGNAPSMRPDRPQPGNMPSMRPDRPQGGNMPSMRPDRPQPGNMPSMRPDRPQGGNMPSMRPDRPQGPQGGNGQSPRKRMPVCDPKTGSCQFQ